MSAGAGDLSDEEVLAEIERLKQLVATRQTRREIAADLTSKVDGLREGAPLAMGGEFDEGRVHVCPDCVRIYADHADPEEPELEEPEIPDEPEDIPGHVEWEPGLTLHVGETTTYEGVTYRVRLTHETHADRLPPDTPTLYAREE